MRYILISFLIIFSGCSAGWHIKRAEQKCPDCFKSEIKIEYRDTTIILDTLISVDFSDFLEFDTIPEIVYEKEYVNKLVKILPTFDTIIRQQNGLTAKIWMKKGILGANFEVDSTYIYHLQDSITILNQVITKTNTVKIEKEVTFKQYFIAGVGLVFLMLFAMILLAIFKK
jgi:hypothetical protein